jgi:aminoglycoside 2''-phosphotransferase
MVVEPTTAYIRQIERHYPDLQIETASLNQDGQYNDVLIVNDALVFRFPKVPPAVETLEREIAILRSLQGHLSLAIPNPTYHHVGTGAVGEAFAGYRMIRGKPLWRDDLAAVTDADTVARLAAQLSGFLNELHHIDVQKVIPIELPIEDTREEWAALYDRIRAKLFTTMRPDARRQVTRHFEGYLDDPARHAFEPALRHGDFGASNILYAPDRGAVTGIIDFAGTAPGDPVVDFAGLYICYGEAFYAQCAESYPAMARALDRVQFYIGTFALQEALFGIENGDREAFRSGIADYV